VWVNKQHTPYGSALVWVLIYDIEFFDGYLPNVLWKFSNTIVGPFPKSIYNPPKLNCTTPPPPTSLKSAFIFSQSVMYNLLFHIVVVDPICELAKLYLF